MFGAASTRLTNMPRPTASAANTAMCGFFIGGCELAADYIVTPLLAAVHGGKTGYLDSNFFA